MTTVDQLLELQTSDRAVAETATAQWLKDTFGRETAGVRFNPSAASLNSLNGLVELDGTEVFFKTHGDADVIRREHENITLLLDAGYDALKPLAYEERNGAAVLFYPIIDAPKGRDLLEYNEQDLTTADRLIAAQSAESQELLSIYSKTAERPAASTPAKSHVHTLFSERLADDHRYGIFYGTAGVPHLDGGSTRASELFERRWIINDVEQPRSLKELVMEGREILRPTNATLTVVGHGDAHLDNVFVTDANRFLYFDAAFSGRHSPMLDVAKNTFETGFSRWMYYPQVIASSLDISVVVSNTEVRVSYGEWITPVRKRVLANKYSEFLDPLLAWLDAENASPFGRRPFDLAMLCACFVTVNPLADKYPPEITWLALAVATQLGNGDIEQQLHTS